MNACFGCDPRNPTGLHMEYYRDAAGRLAARCRPSVHHSGLGRIVNGGLVATFAEETAAAAAGAHGDGGLVVARVEVDYERPALVEEELTAVVTSSVAAGRSVTVGVDVFSADARVAVLSAKFVLISAERLHGLAGITLAEAPACLVSGRS